MFHLNIVIKYYLCDNKINLSCYNQTFVTFCSISCRFNYKSIYVNKSKYERILTQLIYHIFNFISVVRIQNSSAFTREVYLLI